MGFLYKKNEMMLNNNFILNPKRALNRSFKNYLKYIIKFPFVRFALWCGFINIDYAYVHGDIKRVKIGNNCSTMNTLFNVISGSVTIGDNTLFTHNCMVLTGIHQFYEGKLASLHIPPHPEVPVQGRDVIIGSGCFIGSGAIILGNVKIGDNVIIAAGSVVTKNIPSNCFAGGVPAKVISYHY
jgi:acetyltransferase-like isoleucine patch superfamily enzyme